MPAGLPARAGRPRLERCLGRAAVPALLVLFCLTEVALGAAPGPPRGYQSPWSHPVTLDQSAVLRPPQMVWEPSPEGGALRLVWTSEDAAGLSLVTRTITFEADRLSLGPVSILRGGSRATGGTNAEAGSLLRPHQPLLLPAAGRKEGEGGPAVPRLVWVEGAPGRRSLWMAPLDGEQLGTPVLLAPAGADARMPAAAAAPEGEPPGVTLAWVEGTSGSGRLVVSRLGAEGGPGPAVTVVEGRTVMAFALARRSPVDYGLALERTGERTALLWAFRLDWSSGAASPEVVLESPLPASLPQRDHLDFAWTVSPRGELHVLTILTLRDRSVLPAAYLFRMDDRGSLAPVQTVPLQVGSEPWLSWSGGLDLAWIAPDRMETWQVLSARLNPERPQELTPLPVTAGWRGGFAPSVLRDPEGYLHAAWFSAARGGGWELLYRTDRIRQTTLLAERLASVADPRRCDRFLAFLGFFVFISAAAFLPAQGPALLLLWLWERALGATPSRWRWLAGILAADLASRVGLLPLWSPRSFDLGAWALSFRPAYLLPPLLVLLWLRRRPAQASTHRGRWEVALFYLAAQVAITAWPFTLWRLAGLA